MSAVLLLLVLPAGLPAQEWNAPETIRLVERAIAARRADQGDRALMRHRSRAEGVVTFLVQPGDGAPPRLIKADQLAVEVYWEAPDRSKQTIVGWRERRWLPTDIRYHRDHLGIISNDFGDAIRLGDGDEVLDVLHPLAAAGPQLYQYAADNRIVIRGQGEDLVVREVLVRPMDPARPAVAGSLYLEEGSAALVRFRFGFTASAYRQAMLEGITVLLENALFDQRWWLPHRQEIEIRRRTAWLDVPIRTMIRARWEIGGYDFDVVAPPDDLPAGRYGGLERPDPADATWDQPIDAMLEQGRPPDAADHEAIRREVTRAVGAAAVRRPPARLAFGRLSDLVRVNRVQGLAVGAGATIRPPGSPFQVEPRLAYGTSDHHLTGGVRLILDRDHWWVSGSAGRDVVDIAERPVISPLLNSILAQESGKDHGDWVQVDRFALVAGWRPPGVAQVEVAAGIRRSVSRQTVATPAAGAFRENPPLGSGREPFAALDLRLGQEAEGASRMGLRAGLETGGEDRYVRATGEAHGRLVAGTGTLVVSVEAGIGTSTTPDWRTFVLGGRGTLPGEPFRAFGGRRFALARLEWQVPLGVPSLRLGEFAGTGPEIVLAPFASMGWTGAPVANLPWGSTRGARPVLGVASELLFRLVRIEAGWGVRSNRWSLTLDVRRAWWPIL